MHAFARIRDPGGRLHELVHGDIIGRVWSAALRLNDGRVSEAHAMISLREGELQLLALRGAFAVSGQPIGQVVLRSGLEVTLAPGVTLLVEEVCQPSAVLGLEGEALPRVLLPASCSVVGTPPRVVSGARQEAHAVLWTDGEGWWCRQGDTVGPVAAGDTLTLAPGVLHFVDVPLRAARGLTLGRAVSPPLTLITRFDSVHLHRADRAVVTFSGKQARLISELIDCGAPVSWQALAAEIWGDGVEARVLRSRLDVVMSRIRRALRRAGVRADLVRADGAGLIELLLYPDDRVEDAA